MDIARAFILVGVTFVVTGCPVSQDEFGRIAEEARACEGGDTCVVAGSSDCGCPQAVNADRAEEFQAAADALVCCTPFSCVQPVCNLVENPRCENGECTADPIR